MKNESGKTPEKILSDYDTFEHLSQRVFGREGEKIIEIIKEKISKQEINRFISKEPKNKKIKLLIAEDEPHILEIYKEWLKFENKEVVTASDGQKCLEIYKKEHNYAKENNLPEYFDVVILDHVMPKMTGVQVAQEILKINSNQRIIFASGQIQKILSESISRLNKVVEMIQKPFSIEALDDMINNKTLLDKIEQKNINQVEKSSFEKYNEAMLILQNFF
ncbi:response regulator [Nitrosopumilus sp. K4]|nr:response regulator [Nitrosopumilus sp. K4]